MQTARMPGAGPVDNTTSPHARLRTLPFGDVRLSEGFWTGRQAVVHETSLPTGYHMLDAAGNLHDLRLAAGLAQGEYQGPVFMDSDVYKWLEAAAYTLARRPDPELEKMADSLIELIGQAQGSDGYVDSYWQVVEPERRWQDLSFGHELYCAGHLIQAAVAYHRGTGNTRLLEIAQRFADNIDSVFGPDKRDGTPGHPEIEMALVELYRDTGERRYLDLAQFFVDRRGHGLLDASRQRHSAYFQDHVPVREASTVEGHAVRQLYLTSGLADLYLETGDTALWQALLRQWDDMVLRKMYVTGGLGSRHMGEAFGEAYELPNDRAYCETCAAIASVMWNWRMLLATGESRYVDVLERALYNSILSGISLDGQSYFYVNPLLSHGVDSLIGRKFAERFGWHSCACCPPNVMRLFASLDHYVATRDREGVQIHLYAPADLDLSVAGERRARLRLETEYPWSGAVHIEIQETDGGPWSLSLRIPEWANSATLQVNGQPLATYPTRHGYAIIERAWQAGDVIDLTLPMASRLTEAHPWVDPTRNSLALERGPLVYCLEQPDQDPAVHVLNVEIDPTSALEESWRPDLLGGVVTVEANGTAFDMSAWAGRLYAPLNTTASLARRPTRLTAIPYYAWANRGAAAMRVWIPRGAENQ